jgi:hypothetical protein
MSATLSRSNQSRIAFVGIVLMLFALSFGYLLFVVDADYHPAREFPNWQGAQPIITDTASSSGYFRRQFLLAADPVKAYLVFSGSDDITIYVNGEVAGTSRYFGTNTSDILDITRFVRRGNNLLAVAVDNNAPGAVSELTARLEMLFTDGSRKTLLTNTDWRAKGEEDYSASRHVAWNSPDFVDLQWSPARVKVTPAERPIVPYQVPEMIYQIFPDGYWIGQQTDMNRNLIFLREFQVNTERITGAWLGVSVAGKYTITLNDRLLYSHAGSLGNMELFDIGPYVNYGENRLLVHVESDVFLPRLAVSGLVITTAGTVDFSSDGRWRTLSTEGSDQPASKPGTVIVLQRLRDAPADSRVTLNYKEIETPAEVSIHRTTWFGMLVLMLFITLAAILVLLHLVNRRFDPVPFWKDLETLVFPFLLGSLLALGLLTLSYDIRIDARMLLQPYSAVSIVVIVLAWEAVVMIERFIRR